MLVVRPHRASQYALRIDTPPPPAPTRADTLPLSPVGDLLLALAVTVVLILGVFSTPDTTCQVVFAVLAATTFAALVIAAGRLGGFWA